MWTARAARHTRYRTGVRHPCGYCQRQSQPPVLRVMNSRTRGSRQSTGRVANWFGPRSSSQKRGNRQTSVIALQGRVALPSSDASVNCSSS